MKLQFAVDKLYEIGWLPSGSDAYGGLETLPLPDGRKFPSVLAVQREFARAGLELAIKHNPGFKCYRATWAPVGDPLDPTNEVEQKQGTVIGACEREAAVYALAQLRAAQTERQLATV